MSASSNSKVLALSKLVTAVDSFLVDVSCVGASSETREAVQRAASCFIEKSISVHEFIRRATISLKRHPNLARKLDVFLQASGERLEVVVNELATVELIVIHGPEGGHIYPVSDTIQVPLISNTATLRALLDKDTFEHDFTNATSSSSWAGAVAELLQDELKRSSLDMVRSAKCLRHLRRLAAQKGILPPSFFLHNVVRDGPHPVFGGGFADVYKGKLDEKVVCLKALRFFVERPEMAQKLLNDCCREALVWKQLNHPNVLPFLGVNVDLFAPSFCLVSPWMSNGNLMQFLQRNPDFDRRNAITDIAAAMEYLHGYSPPIVHADIRGANVLVRDDLRCCLADFGLSSVTTSFTLTSSTGNGGSIRWLAPEFFMISVDGDENRSKSTSRDTYAFACTILEVYTGQPPFPQYKFDPPVMYDVLAGKRPPRPPRLSNELWMLVESCWQQDPARRPSAQAIMRFLRMASSDVAASEILVPESSLPPSDSQLVQRDLNLEKLLPAIPKSRVDEERPDSPTTKSGDTDDDVNISLPFNFQHNIHVDEDFVGLPPSWTVSLMDYGFSEDEIAAIHSRRSPASNRPFLWQSTAPRPSENHLRF
ncbi:kinase-like domain-containing protein [Mycena floridula]|nr:kinase-like domain-containing protein [Mycena floridula]